MSDPLVNVLRILALLPNVTVRPSAVDFGDYAPVVTGLHAYVTQTCSGHNSGGKLGP